MDGVARDELITDVLERIRAEGLAQFSFGIGDTSPLDTPTDAGDALDDKLVELRQAVRRAQPAPDFSPKLLPDSTAYFKATADWTNASGNNSYVLCHHYDPDDETEGTETVTVYLHRNGSSEDPNIREDAILLACLDPQGYWVAVNPNLDGVIGKSIRIFNGTGSDVPGGWYLCDGDNGTIDLRTRFVMMLDSEAEDGKYADDKVAPKADENGIGDTGGYRTHGTTENNHEDHATHATHTDTLTHANHSIDDHTKAEVAQCIADHDDHVHTLGGPLVIAAGQDFGAGISGVAGSSLDHFASEGDDLSHNTLTHANHSVSLSHDAHAAHTDADNRPRYYALAFIERID